MEKKLNSMHTREARHKYVHSKAEINFGFYKLQESQLSDDDYEFKRQTYMELPSKDTLNITVTGDEVEKPKQMAIQHNTSLSINRKWLSDYIDDNNEKGQITVSKMSEQNPIAKQFQTIEGEQFFTDVPGNSVEKENGLRDTMSMRRSGSTIIYSSNVNKKDTGQRNVKYIKTSTHNMCSIQNESRRAIPTDLLQDTSKNSFNQIIQNFSKKISLGENLSQNGSEVIKIPVQTLYDFLKQNYKNLGSIISQDNKQAKGEQTSKKTGNPFETESINFGHCESRSIPNTPNFEELKLSNSDKRKLSPFTDIVPFLNKTLNQDIRKLNLDNSINHQSKEGGKKYKVADCFNKIINQSRSDVDVTVDGESLLDEHPAERKERMTIKRSVMVKQSLTSLDEDGRTENSFETNFKREDKGKVTMLRMEKNIERVRELLKSNENPLQDTVEKEIKLIDTIKHKKSQDNDNNNIFKLNYSVVSQMEKDSFGSKSSDTKPEAVRMLKVVGTFGVIQSPELDNIKYNNRDVLKSSLFRKYQLVDQQNSFTLTNSKEKPSELAFVTKRNVIKPKAKTDTIKSSYYSLKRSNTSDMLMRKSKERKQSPKGFAKRSGSNPFIKAAKRPKFILNYNKFQNPVKQTSLLRHKHSSNEKFIFNKAPKIKRTENTELRDSKGPDNIDKNIILFFKRLGFINRSQSSKELKEFIVSELVFVQFFEFVKLIRQSSKTKISLLKKLYQHISKELKGCVTAYDLYTVFSCLFIGCKSEKNLKTFLKDRVASFNLKTQRIEVFSTYIKKQQFDLLKLFLKGRNLDSFKAYLQINRFTPINEENVCRTNKKTNNIVVRIKFDENNQERIQIKNHKEIPSILKHYTHKYNLDSDKQNCLSQLLLREFEAVSN